MFINAPQFTENNANAETHESFKFRALHAVIWMQQKNRPARRIWSSLLIVCSCARASITAWQTAGHPRDSREPLRQEGGNNVDFFSPTFSPRWVAGLERVWRLRMCNKWPKEKSVQLLKKPPKQPAAMSLLCVRGERVHPGKVIVIMEG